MLEDLETRWRNERTPQAGVRLAEALQQQGNRVRAEGILNTVEAQLEDEPRDLASRVAVGGMRLALGQPLDAARVLEQVVQRDPTHLKANKLLVEVYLETGQRDRARDRLDLYRLLNEGDPEIEALEGLVVGVTVPAAPETLVAPPVDVPPVDVPPIEGARVAVAPPGGRRLRLAGGDPFAALVTEAPMAAGPLTDLLSPPAGLPDATATLGALYQEQGHREDAERVFRDVLTEEPDNLRAREGLASLEADGEPPTLAATAPLAGIDADADEDADRQRRIGVLRDYLTRIQRGREAATQ